VLQIQLQLQFLLPLLLMLQLPLQIQLSLRLMLLLQLTLLLMLMLKIQLLLPLKLLLRALQRHALNVAVFMWLKCARFAECAPLWLFYFTLLTRDGITVAATIEPRPMMASF
jgi:hypothetical protein